MERLGNVLITRINNGTNVFQKIKGFMCFILQYYDLYYYKILTITNKNTLSLQPMKRSFQTNNYRLYLRK